MTNKEQYEGKINSSLPIDSEAITPRFDKSDAMVGQLLDRRFLVKRDLTEGGADAGGIGLVYLAEDLKLLGKQVVVKILQKSALKNSDILNKFQHEKEALIRLDHPNIVRILDIGALSDDNPFMVMEYIPGYSLRRILSKKKKLPFEFCAHVIESVTSALGAAHKEKILHRDIKPENIMLTPQQDGAERIRVIDFGIARVENAKLAPATEVERAIGTIRYMAPEQLLGKLNQTPAADIYSCAIVAYEMLMCEPPFKPSSIAEMFALQQQVGSFLPGKIPSSIPEGVKTLLLQALAFDPSDRPQNAPRFGRDLAAALRQPIISHRDLTGKDDNSRKMTFNLLAKTEPISLQPDQLSPQSNDLSDGVPKTKTPDITIPNQHSNSKLPIYLGIGLLILAAAGSIIGLRSCNNPVSSFNTATSDTSNATNLANQNTNGNNIPSPKRQLTYFLNVQKIRDGKLFQQPYRSSGQEIFENDYKFQMVFQSDAEGYFYLYSEDKDKQGKTIYYILYPSPKNNNGSALVYQGQQIVTPSNHFSGSPGIEVMWLIWTTNKMDVLEAIKQSAYPQLSIKDENDVGQLSNFLKIYKDQKNEVEKDKRNQQTVIKGLGDVIVQSIELEHR